MKKGSEFILRRPADNGNKGKFQIAILGSEQPVSHTDGDGFRQVMIESLQDAIEATKAVSSTRTDR